MLKSNSKKALDNIRGFIVENTDGENYGVETPKTFTECARLIWSTFADEYGAEIKRSGPAAAFCEWAAGLPSVLNTFWYYRPAVPVLAGLLEETETEAARYTERDAETMLTRLVYREIEKAARK